MPLVQISREAWRRSHRVGGGQWREGGHSSFSISATPVTPQPGCPHGSAPLPHLRMPPRLHRRADAHEPHHPTADAHGTARPRICQATASPAPAQDIARRILPNGWWAACSPATASPNIPQCLTIRALRLSWISAWNSNSLISSGNTPIRRAASSWLPMLPVATISSLAGLPRRR